VIRAAAAVEPLTPAFGAALFLPAVGTLAALLK
jgi:hypothetical protein